MNEFTTETVKSLVHNAVREALPVPLYRRYLAWRLGYFDVELQLLRHLCDRSRISIDIGASNGSYTVHLLNHSRKCVAFEPRPDAAAYIIERLASRLNDRLKVEAVALSDHSGETTLRILVNDTGRSTLEEGNPIEQAGVVEEITVPTRRLDDYDGIDPVGFVKIDVEGHEDAVLRGARGRLLNDRPTMLIEIEERHKPGSVRIVTGFLDELDYRGFFFRGDRLHPIEVFDAKKHQDVANIVGNVNRDNKYINNFLFFANESLGRVRHLLA